MHHCICDSYKHGPLTLFNRLAEDYRVVSCPDRFPWQLKILGTCRKALSYARKIQIG